MLQSMVIRPIALGPVLGQFMVQQNHLPIAREQGERERDQASTIAFKGTSKDLKTSLRPTCLLEVPSLSDNMDLRIKHLFTTWVLEEIPDQNYSRYHLWSIFPAEY